MIFFEGHFIFIYLNLCLFLCEFLLSRFYVISYDFLWRAFHFHFVVVMFVLVWISFVAFLCYELWFSLKGISFSFIWSYVCFSVNFFCRVSMLWVMMSQNSFFGGAVGLGLCFICLLRSECDDGTFSFISPRTRYNFVQGEIAIQNVIKTKA